MRKIQSRFLICSICILFAALITGQSTQAQNTRTVTGSVLDSNGHMPLEGVNVVIKNHRHGVSTDAMGNFSAKVNTGDILVFSFIGYLPQSVKIVDQSKITVSLQQNAAKLEEVVVTALGIKRQTRSLGYATQQIDNAAINAVKDPGGNIMNSLDGKVAGAVVTPVATGPGGAVRVVLRGNRSISGNNNALIVVDGVPIDNTTTTEQGGSGSANTVATQQKSLSSGYSGSDGAASINPEDVESITVLKGPAAAALYGNRAANGALIITTKSGSGGKMTLNYNGGVSLDQPDLLMKLQNTYGRGNGGQYGAQAGESWGAPAATFKNNVRDFYNNGVTADNSVSVSGGTEKMRGYASYTNNQIQGIVPENSLNRNTLNLRLSNEVLPRLTTDVKITYMNQKINNKPRLGDDGVTNEALIMPRDMSSDSLKDYESFNASTGQPVPVYWTGSSSFQNPYWDVNRTALDEERNRIMLMGSAKYRLTNWLNIQGRYSLDRYDDKITGSFSAGTLPITTNPGGRYQEAYVNHTESNMDVLLSGINGLGKDFSLNYNVGASVLKINGYNSQSIANGLSIPNQFNLNFATTPSFSSIIADKEIQSVYGNAQLSFRKWIYLDVSARNDWSSTLPAPHSYFYPSVGLSAILSDIIKMPKWITYGKVRGSYTQVGNDADPYLLVQTYTYSAGAANGFISRDQTQYIDNLKPEQTKSWEGGLEWRFLDGRLGLDATAYQSNTYNQLIFIGLPQPSGFNQQYVNAGNIQNNGWEVMLSATPVRTKNFTWTTNVNFAANHNKVISLSPNITEASLSTSTGLGSLLIKPGGSYGDIYDYAWARDQKTGQYMIDANGLPVVNPLQKIGNYNPDFTVGWSNQFQYKKLTLSFLLDGRVGGTVISGTDAMLAYYGIADYTTKFRSGGLVLPGVTAGGAANTKAIDAEQLWTNVSQGGTTGYAGFFAYSATNFRLRELSLAYDFPLNNKTLKMLRLSVTGRNLFFLYRGKSLMDIPGIGKRRDPVDPDVAIGASNYQGIESGLLPITRSYGFNLSLSF